MKLRSFVALAPAVALLLAACGGEDSALTDSDTTTAGTETTASAVTTTTPGATTATGVTTVSPATTTPPGATTLAPTTTMPPTTMTPTTVAPPGVTEPPATAPPPPASTDPSTWLLTVEDLGAGWSDAPADIYYEAGQAEGAAACNHESPQVPDSDLLVAYQVGGDDSGAVLNESIHIFPDDAAAAAFYAAQLDAYRNCADPAPYEVVEHPEIGESFLVGMEFMGLTRFGSGFVRKGPVVAVVTTISSLDLQPLPPELLALAANKIQN